MYCIILKKYNKVNNTTKDSKSGTFLTGDPADLGKNKKAETIAAML